MTNRERFDSVCLSASIDTAKTFSTSFSIGIRALAKECRAPIYAIYGYVRFADEIVDTFHEYPQKEMLEQFEADTYQAIERGISLNPILHSFQQVVNEYQIDKELIDGFLRSMEMDLHRADHDQSSFDAYILGSAQVVGLMCLKVFCNGDEQQYEQLKPSAMSLGAAFQKVNFLRDLQADTEELGRNYFPGLFPSSFNLETKQRIEADIEADFNAALVGIRQLPHGARFGVYLAYKYYLKLFKRIRRSAPSKVLNNRIRVPNGRKVSLLVGSLLRYRTGLY